MVGHSPSINSEANVLIIVTRGFSLLMFVGTMWMLVSQRSLGQVNRKMFAVALALLFFSTVVRVLNFARLVLDVCLVVHSIS